MLNMIVWLKVGHQWNCSSLCLKNVNYASRTGSCGCTADMCTMGVYSIGWRTVE